MPTYKTVGLVLRRHNIGEADRIISFLTPDRGKVRAVARGVRKIKSRQAGHLELFCETELMLARGRNLDVVAGARLKRHWPELAGDYPRTALAYLVAEMIDKLVDEDSATAALYRITIEAYESLADNIEPAVAELGFKLKLLDGLGYRPGLKVCVVCGKAVAEEGEYFLELSMGGLSDAGCRREGEGLSISAIKLWRLLLERPTALAAKVGGAAEAATESLPAVDRFYDYVFGRRFRSKQLFSGAPDGRAA